MNNLYFNGCSKFDKFVIQDLKCGNVLNFYTQDGELARKVIDWKDIKWLSEDKKGFSDLHEPILLTKEILLKFGFKDKGDFLHYSFANNWGFEWFDGLLGFSLSKGLRGLKLGNIRYVHDFQNLHYSITGIMPYLE